MHVILKAAVAAALLGSLVAGAVSAAPARRLRPPPDSYLQYQVYSVGQLIQQVQDSPAVRRRFARHFQIPEDQVARYMRANLVTSYVPRTARYTVYCVSRSGRIFAVHQTFRRGTKVFALRNGQPVLKWLCGNPLSRSLPKLITKSIVRRPPVQKVSPSIQELTAAETGDVLVPSEAVRAALLPGVPVSVGAVSSPLFSGLGSGFNALPLAALLPAAFLFSNNGSGGGGGGSNGTPPPVIPPPIIVPVVPEPADAIYLLAALPLAVLGAARRVRGTKRARKAS